MTRVHQNQRKEGQSTWQMHKDPASTQPRSAGSRSKVHTSPLKQKSSSNTHPATLASPKGEEVNERVSQARRTLGFLRSPHRGRHGLNLMRGAHQGPCSAFRRAGSRAQQRSNVKRGKRGREKKELAPRPRVRTGRVAPSMHSSATGDGPTSPEKQFKVGKRDNP